MRVRWNECIYLIMWICVLDNEYTRFWLCKDTGAINRPLRLAECSWCISWLNVNISQHIRHIIPISQQRCWQTVSSRRGRFIVPAYSYISTKWRTDMCVQWNEYMDLIMRKCVFGYARIRARWIGPYAWRNVRWVFLWAFVDIFRNVVENFVGKRRYLTECTQRVHSVYVT